MADVMDSHLPQPWTARDRERGSVSLWMVTAAMAMIILTGLAVDLGGQVLTRQHVADVAAQAARAGGQQLQASRAIRGQGVRTDPALAAAAARAYLAASDVVGTVQLRGSTAVIVHTTATYHTKFLGIIGIDHLPVTGSAESRIVRAVNGVER
jgi:Flp pilus assembly protein TadG